MAYMALAIKGTRWQMLLASSRRTSACHPCLQAVRQPQGGGWIQQCRCPARVGPAGVGGRQPGEGEAEIGMEGPGVMDAAHTGAGRQRWANQLRQSRR